MSEATNAADTATETSPLDPPKGTAAPAPAGKRVVQILAGLAILAALMLLGRQAGAYVGQFAEWVESLGVWGPIVFMIGYAVATVAFIPGSILTMASGAIFGLFYGTIYVFFAATAGTTCAFLIARFVARKQIEKKLAHNEKFAAIDRAIGREGVKIVFLLRLSPAFPYNLLNYALGLTRVRPLHYVLASFGMIPGSFLYVYYGKALGSLAAIAAGNRPEQGAEQWLYLGIGLIATIAVTAYVTGIARRALKEATDGSEHEPAPA